jgi:hypothetical protein
VDARKQEKAAWLAETACSIKRNGGTKKEAESAVGYKIPQDLWDDIFPFNQKANG